MDLSINFDQFMRIHRLINSSIHPCTQDSSITHKLIIKARSSYRSIDLLDSHIHSSLQNCKHQKYKIAFDNLFEKLKKIKNNAHERFEFLKENIVYDWSNDIIKNKVTLAAENYKTIKLEIEAVNSAYLKLTDEYASESANNQLNNFIPNISSASTITPREIFIIERDKINREYRDEINKLRIERKNINNYKSIDKPIEIPTPEPIKIITYKNLDVEERLLSMNNYYFNIIVDLFSGKKGIKLAQVCDLIENQLDGTIEEIGNGSSHKRIRIAKYLVDIISHEAANSTPKTTSAMQAVGGIFRQHGKSHNSGGMSRFNMKLIVDTFIQAGITEGILNELAEKRKGKGLSSYH